MTTAAETTTKNKYISFCRKDSKHYRKVQNRNIKWLTSKSIVDDIVLKAVKAEKSQPRYPVDDDDDDAKKLLETRYQMTDIEFEEFIQALLLENKK